jgi:hypothetical protein
MALCSVHKCNFRGVETEREKRRKDRTHQTLFSAKVWFARCGEKKRTERDDTLLSVLLLMSVFHEKCARLEFVRFDTYFARLYSELCLDVESLVSEWWGGPFILHL